MWVQKLGAGVSAVAFAPDGRTLYVADHGGAVTAWDAVARTRRPLFKLARGDLGPVTRLFTAGDGSCLLALAGSVLRAHDPETGGEQARLILGAGRETVPLPGPDPLVVHAAADAERLLVWAPGSGEPGAAFAGPFDGPFWSYDLSPDGRTAAVLCAAAHAVVLFDLAKQAEAARFVTPPDLRVGTNRVRFTPDGRAVGVFHMRGIQMWDVARGEPVGPLLPLSGRNWPGTTAFHPTARAFAAVNDDGHPALFDLDTGAALRALDFRLGTWTMCVAFSPDGLTCAVGGSNKRFAVFDVDL